MSLYRNLAVLLVLLTSGSSPPFILNAHALPTPIPPKQPRIMTPIEFDGDYDYYSSPSATPVLMYNSGPCQYNPCVENQEPCISLSERTGCLCPGVSGADQPPHAPQLQALVPVSDEGGSGKIEVQWCAPSSVVTGYRVLVKGSKSKPLEFGDTKRRGLLGSLEAGARVCVEAVNKAGHSIATEFSCQRYDPPDSSNQTLTGGVIGGGVAILLLLLLTVTAVILWKRRAANKGQTDPSEGLGNPSYTKDGKQ
uniref:Si:ch1073-303k11.2 n=2 Tax=Myripristis murdjan TaxID=586833 RepID=A0A667X4F4_9TELE